MVNISPISVTHRIGRQFHIYPWLININGGAALKQLEEERTPLYEAAASVVLDNTGTLREAADKAAALFEADETL